MAKETCCLVLGAGCVRGAGVGGGGLLVRALGGVGGGLGGGGGDGGLVLGGGLGDLGRQLDGLGKVGALGLESVLVSGVAVYQKTR